MTLPRVKQNILDGALGLSDQVPTGVQVKVGTCSLGDVNTLYSFSDPAVLRATLGQGPVVESAAHVLATAGGPALCMRVTTSVAGAAGAVTKSVASTGTGTVTVAGAAFDAFDVLVDLTRDGLNIAAGTAAFIYSLDGGDTYSAETAVPTGGVYAIADSNLSLTFVNGGSGTSFVKGDRHTFASTAPGYSAADLTVALTALRANPSKWAFVHVVGAAVNVAGALTIAAAVDVQMAAAAAQYRYAFGLIECPEDTDTNIKTAFANFVSTRVMVAAGYCELTSAISGRTFKRHIAWPVAARISQQDPRRDLARFRDDAEGGPLEGVTKLYRDEYSTEALDEGRFTTLRTFPGQPGFYVTNGRMMASASSDFKFLQFRRLMDLACTVNYPAMLEFLNDDELRVDDTTGFINETDARAIEAVVQAKLDAELTSKNRVSAVRVIIKRDVNILSTQTLVESVRITPKGYSKFIEVDLGFLNPALQPRAA